MQNENESIYGLIPRPQPAVIKPARYRSKVSSVQLRLEAARKQQLLTTAASSVQHPGVIDARQFNMGVKSSRLHATFGLPGGQLAEPPAKFLKSHQKEPLLPTREPAASNCCAFMSILSNVHAPL